MNPIANRTLSILVASVAFAGLASAVPAEKIKNPKKAKAAASPSSPSAKIDRLVAAGHREHGVKAYPLASDEVFVRRIYLDVIGRIPTRKEARAFLADEDPKKRDRLIDRLLASEGYVHHFYNYWADLLRAKTKLTGAGQSGASGHAYGRWIKDALRQNLAYDDMVTELLTAEGRSWENGAVGFYIRDFGMPLDQMAVTTQVFLGTQVVCAQCHDHPFDSWKQLDYYQLAAFSYGSLTTNQAPVANEAVKLYSKGEHSPEEIRSLRRAFNEILKPVRFNNVHHEPRLPRLPHDYQYENAEPKQAIEPEVPAVIGAASLRPREGERPVEAYARWMTSPENPRFTKVIANRLWKKAMGLGVIEPVDEFTESTEATNPALMALLEKLMVDGGYDMRAYLAAIFKSKAYQREAHGDDVLPGLPYHFPGPLLRRMSAEQIWDSLLTLVVDAPDAPSARYRFEGDRLIAEAEWTANSVYDQKPGKLLRHGLEIAKVQEELAAKISAASLRLQEARENDDAEGIRAATGEASELRRELVKVIEETVYHDGFEEKVELVAAADFGGCGDDAFLRGLKKTVDGGAVDMAGSDNPMRDAVKALMGGRMAAAIAEDKKRRQREMEKWGVDEERRKAYDGFAEKRRGLARAAEMVSPAPPGHFLREFGQSDRDIVENSNAGASVTQSLALLNGQILDSIFHPFSSLSRDLAGAEAPDGVIERVYLSMLSRRPTGGEKALLRPLFGKADGGRAAAIRQTVWALINTRQFLFVQ